MRRIFAGLLLALAGLLSMQQVLASSDEAAVQFISFSDARVPSWIYPDSSLQPVWIKDYAVDGLWLEYALRDAKGAVVSEYGVWYPEYYYSTAYLDSRTGERLLFVPKVAFTIYTSGVYAQKSIVHYSLGEQAVTADTRLFLKRSYWGVSLLDGRSFDELAQGTTTVVIGGNSTQLLNSQTVTSSNSSNYADKYDRPAELSNSNTVDYGSEQAEDGEY